MKLIVAISALAALVVAQDLNSLPDCGKKCVNDMLGKAAELGCASGDTKCYCTNPNFSNGLRDCSGQACGAAVQQQVLNFGRSYCASVTGGGATTTTTAAATTTTATTTTSSGASDSVSSASSSASSALESAKSSASSVVSSVSSSLSSAVAGASSKASSGSGGATSSSSGSFAMKTQAPLAAAGVLGLAALLV